MENNTKSWSEKFKVEKEKLPYELKHWEERFSTLMIHMSGLIDAIKSVDIEAFHEELLKDLKGLKLSEEKTFEESVLKMDQISLKDLYKYCSNGDIGIVFYDGKLPVSKGGEDEIAEITNVTLQGESIQITTHSDKEVTLEVLKRIIQILFKHSGLSLSWSKLKSKIIAHGWKVGVKADFGYPIIELLNPNLIKVINDEFPKENDISDKKVKSIDFFGDINSDGYGGKNPKEERIAAVDLDVIFNIRVINKLTGISEPVELNFTRGLSTERGSNIVYIVASTDSETLKKLILKIIKGLKDGKSSK